MPILERDAVVGWLRELRPETVFVEWPPAVRPIETEVGVSSQLTALGEALDQFDGLTCRRWPDLCKRTHCETTSPQCWRNSAQLGCCA